MVQVEIISSVQHTPEHDAALRLKKLFEQTPEFQKAEGRITVFVSFQCYGQKAQDIDLVVFGQFERPYLPQFNLQAKISAEDKKSERTVLIDNFCFTIEVKDHPPENVSIQGGQVFVKYGNRPHPASNQSEQQKYSLKNYLHTLNDWSPFIVNILWLRNISPIQLDILDSEKLTRTHSLPAQFQMTDILNLACNSMNLRPSNGKLYLSSTNKEKKGETAFRSLHTAYKKVSEIRENVSPVTRERVELITKNVLRSEGSKNEQEYAKSIGEKLVLIQGRAGTGKTIRMLQIAHDLAVHRKKRCLILTYNRALVEDLRYHFNLIGKSELDPNGEVGVVVQSVMKYTWKLGEYFGCDHDWITNEKGISKNEYFLEYYPEYIENLLRKIYDQIDMKEMRLSGVIDYKGREFKGENLLFDVVLIDEGQDWLEGEKNILFALLGNKNLIVVDGVDQLVRQSSRCDWITDVDYNDTIKKGLKVSLRQKSNLIRFLKYYAASFDLRWELEPGEELYGGKIIVLTTQEGYTSELHNAMLKSAEELGNTPFDMLFLAHHALVEKKTGIARLEVHEDSVRYDRRFKLAEKWENKFGSKLWDGTSRIETRYQPPSKFDKNWSNKNKAGKETDWWTFPEIPSYPIDIHDRNRVVQYESARGLEGWIVICNHLDEFVADKIKNPQVDDYPSQEGLSFLDEEKKKLFAYLWTMIPLTRAIDTIVITIKDSQSEYAQKLKAVIEKCPDFAEWRE